MVPKKSSRRPWLFTLIGGTLGFAVCCTLTCTVLGLTLLLGSRFRTQQIATQTALAGTAEALAHPSPTSTPTATATPTPTPTPTLISYTEDMPDDDPGLYQVHVLYVVPSDMQPQPWESRFEASIQLGNRWLRKQTGGSQIRFDTYQGRLDITQVRLKINSNALFSEGQNLLFRLRTELRRSGNMDSKTKYYFAFYQGKSAYTCQESIWPGQLGATYLLGFPADYPDPCLSPLDPYIYIGTIHEILHGLGFVFDCSPHETSDGGHVFDSPRDLMYTGNAEWNVNDTVLDVGHDDYFRHQIPGCPDLSNSAFLDPLPAQAEPPDW